MSRVAEVKRELFDIRMAPVLAKARGVVLVNSTVGLSTLSHGTPLMVCGQAIFDMQGLTYQCSLDDFWKQADANPVNQELYLRFRNHLIERTQLNGNFYRRLDITGSCAGLVWVTSAEQLGPEHSAQIGEVVHLEPCALRSDAV